MKKKIFIRKKVKNKEKIKRKGRWLGIEKNLVRFLSKRRVRGLTAFMKFMTRVGDGPLWAILCALSFLLNIYTGLALSLATLLQVILQQIVKHIFVRQRPYMTHDDISIVINPPDRFSFPSGHTAGAFVFVFIFYYFYPFLFAPMLIIATLIGFSRIYLGLHYPSDVLAGVLLGFISARLAIYLSIDVLSKIIDPIISIIDL